jgi:hypothetical protein
MEDPDEDKKSKSLSQEEYNDENIFSEMNNNVNALNRYLK